MTEEMGIQVVRLQEDECTLSRIENAAASSDLLLYTRTWGFDAPDAAVQMFRRLEENGTKTASYHLDLYVGISRENTLVGDPFWSTQYVFTPDGDPNSQKVFERMDINHHYIRPGVFGPECVRGNARPEFTNSVCFVGTVDGYHGEWPYRKRLHKFLQRYYRSGYTKYGHPEQSVRDQDLNDLYASTTVVVGDSLCPGFDKPYYWSDRVYETLGRGGFLVHPLIKGLDEEFINAEHLRFYHFQNFDELGEIIDFYIQNPDMAREISDKGMEFVRNNATYKQRLEQAFNIMEFD
jgi:hypothetical protein